MVGERESDGGGMGNAVPVPPTAERAAELAVALPCAATRAAKLVEDASFVLVCLGSGTRSFPRRGPEETAGGNAVERAGHELGVDDLARDPVAYYGYWGARFNANRELQRHDNAVMTCISGWCRNIAAMDSNQEWYVFTTETDGCAQAAMRDAPTSHLRGLYECFGSTETWRCAGGCHGIWRAPEDFLFQVDPGTTEAPLGDPQAKPTFHRATMSHHGAMDRVSMMSIVRSSDAIVEELTCVP